MSIAYIGIGSNLGERKKNCLYAIELIEKKHITVTKRSSIYETEPWGVSNQPIFLNMAIEIETDLTPVELLKILKDIEKKMGRENSYHWGPRIIDLDILLFDNLIINMDNLKIPHPFLHERDFVLRPLKEIAPGIKHPLLNVRIDELFKKLLGSKNGDA
jgi:2-amino-4-hydroxy-6-hydroxymethyldihydropteridine diphosphokinase